MRVTVMCDASFCPTYKVAGFGFWIASHRGKMGGGGPIHRIVKNNNIAEMMAVCNAVWRGLGSQLILQGDSLLIQSDCLGAMDKLSRAVPTRNAEEKEVVDYYCKLLKDNKLSVEFRHVKGHSSRTEARFLANKMCDSRAKAGMEFARMNRVKGIVQGILDDTSDEECSGSRLCDPPQRVRSDP